MQSFNPIAWLYWNPSREAITIPFMDSIAWYGILFVLGFIIGYFLTVPHFSRLVCRSKHLSPLDILNWEPLVDLLKRSPSAQNPLAERLLLQLDAPLKKKIRDTSPGTPLEPSVEQALLRGLNRLLQDGQIQRIDLEKAFPQTIVGGEQSSHFLVDRLCWFIMGGTLIRRRLGAILFL